MSSKLIEPASSRLAGKERFEEAVSYVEKHDLHKESLAIWANDPEQLTVCPSFFILCQNFVTFGY